MAMGKSRGALPNEQPVSQEGHRHGEDTVAPPEEERCYQANPDFILRKVAGETLAVPTGKTAYKLSALITFSESGAFLLECMRRAPQTKADLIQSLETRYDVAAETAAQDVSMFLEKALENGVVF